MHCGNRVKLMGGEFAQENEVLTLDNTVPWQKDYLKLLRLNLVRPVYLFFPSSHNARVTRG